MSNVVSLTPPSDLTWVCACGCSTFHLQGDGRAICASCAMPATADRPALWYDPAVDRRWTGGAPHIVRDGTDDFARRVTIAKAEQPDVAVIAVIFDSGAVTTWMDDDMDDDQRAWLRRRLATVMHMARGGQNHKDER